MSDARFVIDGREYPVPGIDTFTMGEAIVLHEYSGLTLDMIDEDTPIHPGIVAAFMHIAYERGNPGAKKQKTRQLVESANLVDALDRFFQQEDDAGPPDLLTSSSPTSSETTVTGSGETSGTGSVSGPEDNVPSSTGTHSSGTPQELPSIRSVA